MNFWYDFIFLLTAILTVCVLVFCYRYFSDSDQKIGFIQWLIIIIISFFILKNNLGSNFPIKTFIILMAYIALFYAIFRDSFFKLLNLCIFILLLTLFIELIYSILIIVCGCNIERLNTNLPFVKVFFSVSLCYGIYLIYRIPIFKKTYIRMQSLFECQKNNIIIFYLIFGVVVFLYIIYVLNDILGNVIFFIILIIMFIYFIVFLYFKEKYINSLLKTKNAYLLENQILFKKNMEDYRILKHNLLNDILFIKTLCLKKNQKIINEKMLKYDIIPDILVNVDSIPEGLQGLVYLKATVAKSYDINIYIDNFDFKYDDLDRKVQIDLCEVLGIILDNAIEACNETTEKTIYLNMIDEKNHMFIDIINTFTNEINLEEIGNKNYSTKNRERGLGLNYINKLNKNIKIKKEIMHDLFKITIIIKK